MSKVRAVQIPGDDDIPEDQIPDVIDEGPTPAAEGQEAPPVAEPAVEQAPEPEPVDGRYTREQIRFLSKATVVGLYGTKSVDFPPGTRLTDALLPCEQGQDVRYVVGNLLTRDGWLIGVPVPVE